MSRAAQYQQTSYYVMKKYIFNLHFGKWGFKKDKKIKYQHLWKKNRCKLLQGFYERAITLNWVKKSSALLQWTERHFGFAGRSVAACRAHWTPPLSVSIRITGEVRGPIHWTGSITLYLGKPNLGAYKNKLPGCKTNIFTCSLTLEGKKAQNISHIGTF